MLNLRKIQDRSDVKGKGKTGRRSTPGESPTGARASNQESSVGKEKNSESTIASDARIG